MIVTDCIDGQKVGHFLISQYRFLQIGLETGNKKPFWKYLRVQKQKDFGISALKSDSKMFTDRKSISEILNTQFKSVFTKKTSSKIPESPGVTFPSIKDLKLQSLVFLSF